MPAKFFVWKHEQQTNGKGKWVWAAHSSCLFINISTIFHCLSVCILSFSFTSSIYNDDNGNGNGNDNGENPNIIAFVCSFERSCRVVSWLTAFVLYTDCHAFSNATSTDVLAQKKQQCRGWRCISLLSFSAYTLLFLSLLFVSHCLLLRSNTKHTNTQSRNVELSTFVTLFFSLCCLLFVSQFD